MAIFVNFLLRFTWSIKLSAHLHMSGALFFFWLEVAELLRRWIWVFFRVEWEYVKKLNDRDWERWIAAPRNEEECIPGRYNGNMDLEMMNSGSGEVVFDAGIKSENGLATV